MRVSMDPLAHFGSIFRSGSVAGEVMEVRCFRVFSPADLILSLSAKAWYALTAFASALERNCDFVEKEEMYIAGNKIELKLQLTSKQCQRIAKVCYIMSVQSQDL